jgi:hypothetical protein
MTPGEIRACYRLYAAHRKSREICTFAGTIPVINKPGDPDDLAGLLRLHTGLEGLARDIGHGDLASFAAQLFGRGALVGR